MRWRVPALAAGLSLAACVPRQTVPMANPHYVVGAPYEAGGAWYYPRETFTYDVTGLAERLADRSGVAADGEALDPAAMTGAHQTLQLPAIVRVTNLENGREIVVRLNDRGPANPGRLIGLTRRAADLIGLAPGATARVRVAVESGPSQALRDRLHGGPSGVTAAPVAAVVAENLPPPGRRAATPSQVVLSTAPSTTPPMQDTEVPDRLPATVRQGVAQPGQLWLLAGQFSQVRYANTVKAKLSGMQAEIRREAGSSMPNFVVMAGPFASVAAADAALDQARAAGVTDAVIAVE